MITHYLTWPTALLIAAWPSLVMAADTAEDGGDHAQPGLLDIEHGTAVWTFVLFIGLLWFLGKYVWPHIVEGLDARESKIREDIEAAEKANADARASLASYEAKLAEAQTEVRGLLDKARADAESLRQKSLADTEADIAKARQRATDEIAQARESAVHDMHAHAAELAVAVASKILQRQVSDDDTQSLVDQSLSELDKLDSAS
ncbi:MAG: F0F1 ATP synthase subunit B [Planctomycetota bacterium]|jgi:F-type H+-transporting ATPase subunit b